MTGKNGGNEKLKTGDLVRLPGIGTGTVQEIVDGIAEVLVGDETIKKRVSKLQHARIQQKVLDNHMLVKLTGGGYFDFNHSGGGGIEPIVDGKYDINLFNKYNYVLFTPEARLLLTDSLDMENSERYINIDSLIMSEKNLKGTFSVYYPGITPGELLYNIEAWKFDNGYEDLSVICLQGDDYNGIGVVQYNESKTSILNLSPTGINHALDHERNSSPHNPGNNIMNFQAIKPERFSNDNIRQIVMSMEKRLNKEEGGSSSILIDLLKEKDNLSAQERNYFELGLRILALEKMDSGEYGNNRGKRISNGGSGGSYLFNLLSWKKTLIDLGFVNIANNVISEKDLLNLIELGLKQEESIRFKNSLRLGVNSTTDVIYNSFPGFKEKVCEICNIIN